MIQSIKDLFKRLRIDVVRLILLALLVLVLIEIDNAFRIKNQYSFLAAVLSSTTIVLIIAGFSHVLRRILFPNIDLKEFAKNAEYHPVAAAIVFLGVCLVLITFVIVNVMLLS